MYPNPLGSGKKKPLQVGACSSVSAPPGWTLCDPGQPCRTWGYVPPGSTFTLADNRVTGAQIGFLVEGLDVGGELAVSGNVSDVPAGDFLLEGASGAPRFNFSQWLNPLAVV